MASKRYVKEPGAKKGYYLPCPNCHEKVCVCIERYLKAALEVAGLPEPDKQIQFCSTRKWKSDFGYVDRKILIEVEGGGGIGRHSSASGYREDCVKYNVAALMGWTVLRFDKSLIARGIAIEMIRASLAGTVYVPEFSTARRKVVAKTPENSGNRPETPKNAQKSMKKPKNARPFVEDDTDEGVIRFDFRDPVDRARALARGVVGDESSLVVFDEIGDVSPEMWDELMKARTRS